MADEQESGGGVADAKEDSEGVGMDYRLILGDCLEEMKGIEDGSVDCIIADLPYGTTACKWDVIIPFEPLWKHYKRVIKRNGAVVLFADEPFTSILVCSNLKEFSYRLTWRKSRPTGFLDANRKPLDDTEDIVIFYQGQSVYNPQMWKGQPNHISNGKVSKTKRTSIYGYYKEVVSIKTNDKYPRRVIDFQSLDPVQKTLHPNQKPVALLEYLILTYTNPGELVLDNVFGSCSTGEAALRTGRRFVGIEKDEAYYQIGVERMERVAAELRGEYRPKPARGKIEDLPMFEGTS